MPVVLSEGAALGRNDPNVAQDGRAATQEYKERLFLSNIPTYLSALALITVLYFAVQRAGECIRRRRRRREQPLHYQHRSYLGSRQLRLHTNHILNQQRLYSHFPRPAPFLHPLMEEKSRGASGQSGCEDETARLKAAGGVRFAENESSPTEFGAEAGRREPDESLAAGEFRSKGDFFLSRRLMTRPPPPPPLTPPELSSAFFTFDDPRRTFAPPAELPESFIHQPNPDYMSSTTTALSPQRPTDSASPSTPRRRSYTKMVPIGIPAPPNTSSASSDTAVDLMFSPSSYPPTSPMLPPPYESYSGTGAGADAASATGTTAEGSSSSPIPVSTGDGQDFDFQGEIISVMDDAGAGWKRHTRVYGGGVCLACAASSGGGYYGDTVTPEEMR